VKPPLHSGGWKRALRELAGGERASQIVEFAVSLPVLVLFVVGIFDFSGALALKHKLTNAARESARVAAADPSNDMANPSTPIPSSVIDAYQVVDNYLISENVNDCGLNSTRPLVVSAPLVWRATALGCAGGAAPGFQLTINRGCSSAVAMAAGTVNVVGTCVTIIYPYTWQFTGVAGLFGGFSGPTGITTSAMAFNEN
jgi:Flp pilus assembly protein TadG